MPVKLYAVVDQDGHIFHRSISTIPEWCPYYGGFTGDEWRSCQDDGYTVQEVVVLREVERAGGADARLDS